VKPLLQSRKLLNVRGTPLPMPFLEFPDRYLLQPFIRRAIPDSFRVTLVLEINVGQDRQKRLQQWQKV
jgi:hypothetical protein